MENLIVDCAYTCKEYPNNCIVEINGEFYLLPSVRRNTNDLNAFKKIPNDVIKNKELVEFPNYRYPTNEFEKKDGIEIKIGRPITNKEFDTLKEELSLTDDDISEPFEQVLGGIYGKKSEKRFKAVQIRVEDIRGCEIERKLRKKGIQADNCSSGRVDIRIPE